MTKTQLNEMVGHLTKMTEMLADINNEYPAAVSTGTTACRVGRYILDYHSCKIWENRALVLLAWYKELLNADSDACDFDLTLEADLFDAMELQLMKEADATHFSNQCSTFYYSKKNDISNEHYEKIWG